jgi:hypothetical protein
MPARELRAGDVLVGHDGREMAVEGVEDTGRWATVYNLRVAEYHTYFVGCQEWGFSVWAHNADCIEVLRNATIYRTRAEARRAALDILGIPRNQKPTRTWQLVDPSSTAPRGATVITEPNPAHQGTFYEYNINGRYKYIVEHTENAQFGGYATPGHFHTARSPYGWTQQLQPGDRYLNLGSDGPSAHIPYLR